MQTMQGKGLQSDAPKLFPERFVLDRLLLESSRVDWAAVL